MDAENARLTPLKGLFVLAGVVGVVAVLVGIGILLQLPALYAGFLFALYWTGLFHAEADKFLPSLIGSLGGLALAYALTALPASLGETAGVAIAALLVLLAIYAIIMKWLPVLINYAFMLFLTVGSIPALHNDTTLWAMACAVIVAAAYTGALVFGGKKLAARSARSAG
ncbi:hypothetical protein [Caenibius sp. WL]|uniref:hypothetical protein n=1 Tax=Caenibius sp. WL TaxID=2872646 RepID=UPI001C9957C9|nr:hypothetical protein [Caenibius sp. WL]QZP09157.1 hypothetical protein K5X80_05165 [Caenibius sp. WL]